MKTMIITLCFFTFSAFAIAPEKADLGRSKKHVLRPVERHNINEEALLQNLLQQSETAYSLATAKISSFQDARLNALTNRIQDDQKIIQEAIRDTARLKDLNIPQKSASIASAPENKKDYLNRQVKLHEQMVQIIQTSSSPVLRNMKKRIETTLNNIQIYHQEEVQAQEDDE